MKTSIFLILCLLVLNSCSHGSDPATSPGANSGSWAGIKQMGVPGSGVLSYASAIDSVGNVFVGGRAYAGFDGNALTGSIDLFITKFDSSASKKWTRQLGCSGNMTIANSMVTDTAGNVFISGYTKCALDGNALNGTTDTFVTKYSTDGVKLWTKQIGAAAAIVQAYGLAIDSSNSVYVSGSTNIGFDGNSKISGSSNNDAFITKFNSNGNKLWTKQLGSASYSTDFSQVAIDSTSNIFVAGNQGNGFYVVKLNSAGTQLWINSLAASSGSAFLTSVKTDSFGNVFASSVVSAGIDGNAAIGTTDSAITKYNSAGTKQWTKQLGASGKDTFVYSINTDSGGNVILVGFEKGNLDGNTLIGTQDYYLTKYNSLGSKVWSKQYGVAGVDTIATSITTDFNSNVYIAGYTYGAFPGNLLTGIADFFVAKYNPSGALQ